ncbi:HalOD1 output domain-containing protein [Natronolimnohabitans innermongolicus]|uniref:Halobacterial output domain-containing protein n=1 Tax=Natronolimnohabitans innermongolicus JCM 12255 TaxID=1227499 RepID=L9XFY0_9EURY|nr:HalOD1 output domain-containing protein [Natronolimnohabitans innermongolicus]ELY60639.1 hypothetical protein C493_04161 [Natronolimnohabitans innermongolicus JCM 12255]
MTEGDGNGFDTMSRRPPSRSIIEAVAEAEGVPAHELRPPTYESLHTVIDPDALDALFEPHADGTVRPAGRVTFPYCGYTVTVDADGSVSLE